MRFNNPSHTNSPYPGKTIKANCIKFQALDAKICCEWMNWCEWIVLFNPLTTNVPVISKPVNRFTEQIFGKVLRNPEFG